MAKQVPISRQRMISVRGVSFAYEEGPPLFTGLMLEHSTVGWPLVVGGALKIVYDLLLLAGFRTRASV